MKDVELNVIHPVVKDEGCGPCDDGWYKIVKHCGDCVLQSTYLCDRYVKFHNYRRIIEHETIEIVIG